tara:strand:- start:12357 stop:13553 length:1197 start_codon:yes stop_codon:yes gene_type:complete
MANTLNLGNGNWGVKKDSLLGYNSENGNYKPLPFDFTRASSATVVNKDGLIETVGSGEPRIDFKDNTKGALKLEPQRTNYQPYSTDFSVWGLSGATVNINYGLSPDGLNNSTLITEGTGSAQHRIVKGSPASSGIYTLSCFVKNKVGNHQAYIDMGAVTGFFSFDTKTMFSATGTTSVEIWSDDWYRISITSSSNITPIVTFLGIGKNNNETFQGDGSSAIEFFAPQLEQGSYATSYIPTSGQANGVTRVAESCNGAGNEQVFNDSEGTFFIETSALANSSIFRNISISDGTTSNLISLIFTNANQIRLDFTNQAQLFDTTTDITNVNKIAFSYKLNEIKLYVNGVLKATDTNATMPSNLNTLRFDNTIGAPLFSKTKDIKYFNTALTDQELISLTKK